MLALDRRQFLASAGAVCVAIAVPVRRGLAQAGSASELTAYVIIEPNGDVVVVSPVSEMGQGTYAAHAAIVADELGVDYERVSVRTAEPADPYRRRPPGATTGGQQSTGGSWGVRAWIGPLRRGAAQAREMLIAAAAAELAVPAEELTVTGHGIVHPASGRRLEFGALATAASRLEPPESPPLRPASERRYVGMRLERPDLPPKVRGEPIFSADFERPGMVYACATMAPVHGAAVRRLDDERAREIPGVIDVVRLSSGAAVVASSTWAAMRGAEVLQVEYEETPGARVDSESIRADLRAGLEAPSRAIAVDQGDPGSALEQAAKRVTADYEVPYLAHAPMEPWSCTVAIDGDGNCEIWAPTQAQDRARTAAADALGIAAERVRIHTLLVGGGFGRRLGSDGIGPAVQVARAVGKPVKFFWTRETEFAVGWDRPTAMARLSAALDREGRLTALTIRTAAPSLAMHFVGADPQGEERATFVDWAATQNLSPLRYRLPAYRVDYALRHNHFPTAPWRSVGATHNAYFLEAFIDEVARAAGRDPLAFRRDLLADDARGLALIDELARRSRWGSELSDGHALGCSFFECYGSLCAQAAEVSLQDGWPRVHRFVTVLDCGGVVTPDGARAQVEGSVVQGLSTTLYEAHTLESGAAVERNFDSYRLLRVGETPPVIETYFLESGEDLGGVGEPPLPPVAPAVVNALYALTGKPLRSLPLSRHFRA